MEQVKVEVPDGTLTALRFGAGPKIAIAAHGITASAMAYLAVARRMPADWSLIALDLRGRGGSAELPGPYGMTRHAEDICAAATQFGQGRPVALVGQSMGAYAALRAATRRPELFTRLVLVDGGLPLPTVPGADPDAVLAATLGPAIARLSDTFPSVEAYVDFFRAHPALAAEWTDDMTEYVRYDATGPDGAIRSRVNPEAVRADGRDLLVEADSFAADLRGLAVPTVLLHAPRGMFGQEPGLLPEPLVAHWRDRAPHLVTELVDANHYTILMTDGPAATIARRLTAEEGSRG
ncbi:MULTISPECIES: alpha/beta fold hydrolase [Micromonospora]|uniref:Alpha/beta hydrolase n=1 Tax=Micromonospora solifontis TaxID=2487138 RepID=A0ABX9WE29_9ACTN|nr:MULTISPECIES: alpha/beta hydrolase [Micromonospora]NES16172.1 alpha/beta hydrolase [Micromonospora sp. PPF5-17B]NES38027.1 alpha/beta hydrolase [Micromonospora solifontis]NES57659.1 alpha/beta hydrolase [Micromonospora sp. PPF5-6]RNL97706.1 alpha/beta hydrolase [Micromonospora solifontis]